MTSKNTQSQDSWGVKQSSALYRIGQWGADYFHISDKGEVAVCPSGQKAAPSLSLMEVVAGLEERGIEMPVLLRFGDILKTQIQTLYDSFAKAMDQAEYRGGYQGVYPIKVNQQQQVIEELTRFGEPFGHGLEAGSKPELIAALTYLTGNEPLLICNGYKDAEFIDLALYAKKLGIRSVIVVETLRELPLIIQRSKDLDIKPCIGLRVKLSSRASGHWESSCGDQSVFGLNVAQIIEAIQSLRDANMLDCLELLHYHLGSQVSSIRDIRSSLTEAGRIYAGLVQEGAKMGMLDIGGGLAVDYDGSHTNFASSRNYTLNEYCSDVVEVIQSIMEDANLPHPTIVTEAGRATVAHHSVLLFNVLDSSSTETRASTPELPSDVHDYVKFMQELATKNINAKNCQEVHHDAIYYRDEVRQLFKHGSVTLSTRAFVEECFGSVMRKLSTVIKEMKYVPDDFDGLERSLADIYYANISVFQSLPDSWAIDQLFPIMPIHRLDERPTRHAVLSDITCDCDGKIDRFIDLEDVRHTLPLHILNENEEYYLGIFLVGAYQETLGDLHNLFGDTHVVSIHLGNDGEIQLESEIEGDSVADVLSYVEYDPKAMLGQFKKKAEKAVRDGRISPQERKKLVRVYQEGIQGYTYLERSENIE